MLPRRCRWLGAGLLLLLATVVANAFVVPPARTSLARPPRRQQVLVRSSTSGGGVSAADVEAKLEGVWDKDVPSSIEAVIAQAQASLGAALGAGERRVRVDIRTPGLDEALEQTAIREKSLLLSVVS